MVSLGSLDQSRSCSPASESLRNSKDCATNYEPFMMKLSSRRTLKRPRTGTNAGVEASRDPELISSSAVSQLPADGKSSPLTPTFSPMPRSFPFNSALCVERQIVNPLLDIDLQYGVRMFMPPVPICLLIFHFELRKVRVFAMVLLNPYPIGLTFMGVPVMVFVALSIMISLGSQRGGRHRYWDYQGGAQ